MATHLYNNARAWVLLLLILAVPFGAWAQTEEPATADTLKTETPTLPAGDDEEEWLEEGEKANAAFERLENMPEPVFEEYQEPKLPRRKQGNMLTNKEKMALEAAKRKVFIPDPKRALWLSFVIPGGGQIYNRKYWKLPIFYGGFLGCMYAFTWNQQMYMDYSQAYLDIMDDNPNTNSYLSMFPPSYNIEGNVSRFQTVFKNRKDRYRRWRDLSTFCFIGVYALSIIDAYVDAHLSVFDISPDLSLQWGPTSIEGPHSNIGIGAALNF